MSLDARLKQGLINLADPIDVDYEPGLVRVQAVARQRERRNVMIAAFAGAVAAIALLALGGRVADLVLGIEIPLPTVVDPNLEDDSGIDESRFEENSDGDKVVQDDDLRLDEALEQTDSDPTDGGRTDVAGRSSGSSAYVPPTKDSGDPGQQPEKEQEPVASESRTARALYAGSAVPVGGGQSACDEGQGDTVGCVTFQTEAGETSVEISIEDASSGDVAAAVQIDRDGDGDVDGDWTFICNETMRPIRIPSTGDAVVYVELSGSSCNNGADSNPTSGNVTAVFAT